MTDKIKEAYQSSKDIYDEVLTVLYQNNCQ